MVYGRGSIAEVTYSGDDDAAPEIKKLLADVVTDEDEYAPWEKLVAAVEALEGGLNRNSSPAAIELFRDVYDRFLDKFPLFFGYWHKYAELEFAIGGTEAADMVYERGVACVPNSVDLWSNYCVFKTATSHDPDVMRE
jgi:pre-mRNA-processing factor 39